MNIFDDYTRRLLIALNTSNVEYLVVGGFAVNFHGYRRTTGDIDLWVRPDNGINKTRLIQSIRSLGISEVSLERITKQDFSKPVAKESKPNWMAFNL